MSHIPLPNQEIVWPKTVAKCRCSTEKTWRHFSSLDTRNCPSRPSRCWILNRRCCQLDGRRLRPDKAPAIGATQNNQSCETFQPPTNTATPVLRAGLTEVLVTGMLINMNQFKAKADCDRCETLRCPLGGSPQDNQQEHHGHNDFSDQCCGHRITAGRM